jgi:hypothetical protein
MADALGTVHTSGRGWVVASRLKVSFSPDASTSPGNNGWLFVQNYSDITGNWNIRLYISVL